MRTRISNFAKTTCFITPTDWCQCHSLFWIRRFHYFDFGELWYPVVDCIKAIWEKGSNLLNFPLWFRIRRSVEILSFLILSLLKRSSFSHLLVRLYKRGGWCKESFSKRLVFLSLRNFITTGTEVFVLIIFEVNLDSAFLGFICLHHLSWAASKWSRNSRLDRYCSVGFSSVRGLTNLFRLSLCISLQYLFGVWSLGNYFLLCWAALFTKRSLGRAFLSHWTLWLLWVHDLKRRDQRLQLAIARPVTMSLARQVLTLLSDFVRSLRWRYLGGPRHRH